MKTDPRIAARSVFAFVYLAPLLAFAQSQPLVSFGNELLTVLSRVIGPIVFGIGIAVAAFSLVFGSRDGFHKAGLCMLGGGMLFSVNTIITWIQSIAR